MQHAALSPDANHKITGRKNDTSQSSACATAYPDQLPTN